MDKPPSLILGTGSRYEHAQTTRERELIAIPARDLMHIHVIGKSGYGKSYFLAALFVLLLSLGISATLIDPAGDLTQTVLRLLISTGYFATYPDVFSRLIYLNLPAAARRGLYVPFNILNASFDPYSASDMVLEAFKRAWPALKSGAMTNIETLVKIVSYVLAVHQLPLLPYLSYLFTDAGFRQRLLADIHDELIHSAFAQYGFTRDGAASAAIQPTIKRINLLAFNPLLRYSLGQQHNVLDFRKILAEGRSVILNLNLESPDALRLWGCLCTVYAEMGAKARGTIPDDKRTSKHVLFLDEFQNFVAQSGDALSAILEQCRKYDLFLCLAHQYWDQVPESLRGALNQCEIAVAFHLERSDAKITADLLGVPYDEFWPKPVVVTPYRRQPSTPQFYSRNEQRELFIDAITHLNKREAFVRLPSREAGSLLYTMRTLDADDASVDTRQLAAVEDEYFHRYFRSQADIEEETVAQLHRIHSAEAKRPKNAIHIGQSAVDAILTKSTYGNNIPQERSADDDEWESLREEADE